MSSYASTNMRGYDACSYEYDGAGNRELESCGPEGTARDITYNYDSSSNRLASLEWAYNAQTCGGPGSVSRAISHDVLGRSTAGYRRKFPLTTDVYALGYDAVGRVESAVTLGFGEYIYHYNHKNQRVAKTDDEGNFVRFAYDLSGRLLAERNGDVMLEYIYLGGEPVMLLKSVDGPNTMVEGRYALGTDQLGSPVRAWDVTTGQAVWAADYEAFGRAWEYVPGSRETPTVHVNLRFPGQYYDWETGLHYNWWRYYDPDTGRYLQPDPVSIGTALVEERGAGGAQEYVRRLFNPQLDQPFAYSLNTPLMYTDPDGRNPAAFAIPLGFCAARPDLCQAAVQTLGAAAALVGAAVIAALCEESSTKNNCPPCPPSPPPEIDVDHAHYPCPGAHWHYRVCNQNPKTCQCFLSGRLFGGCL